MQVFRGRLLTVKMERFYLILSFVVISGVLSSGQMIEEDREILISKNLFDQNIKILKYLEGLQEKVTSLENKIDSLEDVQMTGMESFREMQRTIGDTLREHRAENQLCAKQDQVEDFKNTYVSGKQEIVTSVERSSFSDHLLDLQVLFTADECEDGSHNCSEMATCKDRPIMYKCTCSPGYFGDGFTCTDVDECHEPRARCGVKEICINYAGSYECLCQEGYEMGFGGCQDIDECQRGQHQCQSPTTCVNIDGSYECQCTPPYKRDGESCKFVCESPSLLIRELGCITLLREEITWSEAKVQCETLGMKLLEDIKREHFDLLVNHFADLKTKKAAGWVGFQELKWISSGRFVSNELVADNEGDLDGGCGALAITVSDMGLWDFSCKYKLNSFCKKNP